MRADRRENTDVARIVERWLLSLEQLLPGSSAALWSQEHVGLRLDDGKLLRMLRLDTERPWQLALLNDEQLRCLAAKVTGRISVERFCQDTHTRAPTAREVADALGMTHRRFRRVIEEAHRLVRVAIDQRRAA